MHPGCDGPGGPEFDSGGVAFVDASSRAGQRVRFEERGVAGADSELGPRCQGEQLRESRFGDGRPDQGPERAIGVRSRPSEPARECADGGAAGAGGSTFAETSGLAGAAAQGDPDGCSGREDREHGSGEPGSTSLRAVGFGSNGSFAGADSGQQPGGCSGGESGLGTHCGGWVRSTGRSDAGELAAFFWCTAGRRVAGATFATRRLFELAIRRRPAVGAYAAPRNRRAAGAAVIFRADRAASCSDRLAGGINHRRSAGWFPALETRRLHVVGGDSHDDPARDPGAPVLINAAARDRRRERSARGRRGSGSQGATSAAGGGSKRSAAIDGAAPVRAWSGAQDTAPGQIDDQGRAAENDEVGAARAPSIAGGRSRRAWQRAAVRASRAAGGVSGIAAPWQRTTERWSGYAPRARTGAGGSSRAGSDRGRRRGKKGKSGASGVSRRPGRPPCAAK